MSARVNRYSASVLSAAVVPAGTAYAEMLAGAERSISVKEISVTAATNIGGGVALSRAHAIGTGAATGIATGVAHQFVASAPSARLQAAWSSSGVTPTGYVSQLRRDILPIATGSSVTMWRASEHGPLLIEPNSSLLVVNAGTGIQGGAVLVNVTWEEGPL